MNERGSSKGDYRCVPQQFRLLENQRLAHDDQDNGDVHRIADESMWSADHEMLGWCSGQRRPEPIGREFIYRKKEHRKPESDEHDADDPRAGQAEGVSDSMPSG